MLRRPPLREWEPHEVGRVDRLQGETTATLLVHGTRGWKYGDEIPIRVRLQELEWKAGPPGTYDLFWSGIEVVVERERLPAAERQRHYITAALLPPSFLWHAQAPLLPGGRSNLPAGDIEISMLSIDPFESDPRYLVARLGDFARPHWKADQTMDLGDGFLVMRSPNRKSADRMWMFGLCPGPPDVVVAEIEQEMQEDVHALMGGYARFYRPPRQTHTGEAAGDIRRKLDRSDRQRMGTAHTYTPGMEMAELSLNAAVRQSLARPEHSKVSLQDRVRKRLMNHYRDLDQRLAAIARPARRVRARLEKSYREFVQLHPECDKLRRGGRLQMKLLDRNAELSEEIRFCRDLFVAHLQSQ